MESVRAVGDPERVDRIGTQRMYQCRDLRGVDFSIAGADRMDAIRRQGVAEQRAELLKGTRGIAYDVDALGVVFPVGASVGPSFRQGTSPRVEVGRLIRVSPDDGLDGEVFLQAFQGRDEEWLRVGQADQPDMGDPFRLAVAASQLGTEVVVILQSPSGQHFAVTRLQRRQIVPALNFRVLGQGGHAGEIQPLGRPAQLITQFEQRLRQPLRFFESELSRLTVREQVGQGRAICRLQDLDPRHQRIRRTRRLGVLVSEV